ncbi:MAG: LEA type 2 family protein [Treponema sp.]|nr:LEA type 2 family protein [Treponema sp.]
MKLLIFLAAGLVLSILCLACKTKGPAMLGSAAPTIPNVKQTDPAARLFFERIEAENVEHLRLHFVLEVENPRTVSADLDIQDWGIQINNQPSNEGAYLILDSNAPQVNAGASARFPMRLDLDMNKLRLSKEEIVTEYLTELQMYLRFAFETGDTAITQIRTEAVFPRIEEPEFSITSIAVRRGEQVNTNTHFRVGLHIDNPNVFPLELSALSYSFYGNGAFWADGQENIVLHIPAKGSTETQVFLMINFIDISKNLKNQLITLKRVQYRLTGETKILTNIVYLPEFSMDFDIFRNSDME